MSAYDSWKTAAPESGADDEPPRCDVDGCPNEGLNMVGTGYGTTFVCEDHQPGKVDAGGTPGCAGGTAMNMRLPLYLGLLCACAASWAAIVTLLIWLITWSR